MPVWLILLIVVLYVGLLFAIAWWGDRGTSAKLIAGKYPWIYGLSIAVYATSWTFYGAVGSAATSGWDYLPIYLGPLLVFTLGYPLLRKIVAVGKGQHTTSIADFISSRYGKSQGLAALVTIIATAGSLPYIALQLKSVATSFTALASHGHTGVAVANETVLAVAVALALFAILFGTRHADATEHNRGMILAIAFESAVKLVALVSVALFAWLLLSSNGVGLEVSLRDTAFVTNKIDDRFVTLTLLGMGAILCLPRQFHVMVVECQASEQLKTARWIFAGYLAIISIVVIPIALAGSASFAGSGNVPDLYVLSLPLLHNMDGLALFVFIGGFSAATGMVIVATVALSTMITNDLINPLILNRQAFAAGTRDFSRQLVNIRRAVIIALMALAYLYYLGVSEGEALANLGILSFAAAIQFIPALIGGIYWKRGRKLGVAWGLCAGFLVWFQSLALPAYIEVEFWSFGDLLGFTALDELSRGVIVSLGVNILAYIGFSMVARDSVVERVQAAAFVQPQGGPAVSSMPGLSGTTIADVRTLLEHCLGQAKSDEVFDAFAVVQGRAFANHEPVEPEMIRMAEGQLSRMIGASSARILMSSALKREGLPIEDVVTLLDETSQKINFNQELLQTTLENLAQGVSVVNDDLELVAWNSCYLDMYQYPSGFIYVGRPIEEVIRYNAMQGELGAGDLESQVARRMSHLRDKTAHDYERVRPNGNYVKIQGTPLPGGGYVTSYTDVTEYKRIEHALTESERSMRFYMDNIPALISYTDSAEVLRFANHAYLELFRHKTGILGKTLAEYLTHDEYQLREPHIKRALAGSESSFDCNWRDEKGATVHFQVSYVPQLDSKGRVQGFFGLYQDITARRDAELALQQTNESLEQRVAERTLELSQLNQQISAARKAAEDATASKTRFLAAASHDLLQPMNAARLFTSALKEEVGESVAAAGLAAKIDQSIKSADALLRALLDISKLDAGGLKPRQSAFSLDDLLEELETEFSVIADNKDIALKRVPCSLFTHSDRGLLLSVFQNLVSNAIRYTRQGRVVIGCRRRTDCVEIQVWDTGPGIPEDKQVEIFEEFKQLDNNSRDQGIGLGLAITRRITDLLGHPLGLRSMVGKGSVFTVTVPRTEPGPAAAGTRKVDPARVPLANTRVLCIDNEPEILEAMSALLSRWGAEVLTANSRENALKLFADGEPPPSLVILDYQLDDGETGFDALQALELAWACEVNTIVATASPLSEIQPLLPREDIIALRKPIEPAALRALINRKI